MALRQKVGPSVKELIRYDLVTTNNELRLEHVNRVSRKNEIDTREIQHQQRQAVRRVIKQLCNGIPF